MVDLEVYNGYWDVLYNKRADLTYGTPHAIPSSEGIISKPAGQIKWDLVVSPSRPLAVKRHPLESNELCHYSAVCTRDTSVNFPPMQAWLLEGQKPIFAPDFTTAIVLMRQNVGIGYISHHLALPLLNSGKLLKRSTCEHKRVTKLFPVVRLDGVDRVYQWCIEYLRNPQLTI